jgi:protease-4
MTDLDPDALNPKTQKSWRLIEKLVLQNSRTLRNQQRWSIFFRLLFFVYVGLILWLIWPNPVDQVTGTHGPMVAQVAVNGVIAAGTPANAEDINAGLEAAFKSGSKIIMLRINSPGGSPVQAGQVYREIRYLKSRYPHKKVVAVITDVGASGAYYIASAADDIYADPASIVGSIGVIMEGFGFDGTLKKLGVERRVLTAGTNKDILDPFKPMSKEQETYVKAMLNDIHGQFINAVKQGRGKRLKIKGHPDIFSGLFWTGDQALKLGLIDGLGSPLSVTRDLTGGDNIVDYTIYPNRFEKLMQRFGASVGQTLLKTLGLESQTPVLQ